MLQSMGLQRVGHDSATELNYTLKRRITVTIHNILMIPGVCSKAKEKKRAQREKNTLYRGLST